MVTRREPLDAGLGEVFAVAAARRAGLSRDRLVARDLTAPFWGARARTSARATEGLDAYEIQRHALIERCQQYAVVAPARFAFSHQTAARLFDVPLPSRLMAGEVLHVAVPAGSQPPRRRGIVGHRGSVQGAIRSGMPVVAAEQAWLQLAPFLSVDELIIAGDHLVRAKRPLASLESMSDALRAASGRRGLATARSALPLVRVGTRSPRESTTRLILVRGGLPEPVVGHTVYDEDGFFVGTPDLAYVTERIAIEYQGSDHWTNREVFEDDILRRELFERADWRVILVTDRRLRQPQLLVEHVRGVLSTPAAS